ncbi:MAG: hypothetical protein HYY14_06645 [Candidatus Omnitrophica bacterium]|nr:hypothetical protein [Candidatus Omnitrophota bacterium]
MKINKAQAFYTAFALIVLWVAIRLFVVGGRDWAHDASTNGAETPQKAVELMPAAQGASPLAQAVPPNRVYPPASIVTQNALPALPSSAAAPGILVDNFDRGLTSGIFSERLNSLGSYQGTWAKRPSYSIITKSFEERRGNAGQGLGVEWRSAGGWCGWYTLLMDQEFKGIDISSYNAVTFWVKGAQGGENFDIGLADFAMQELEIDAVYAGSVKNFLPHGITTEWQKVRVPLARVSSDLDQTNMGSLVFWFRYGGSGKVYVEDVWFENDEEVMAQEEYNAPQAERVPGMERALWVWKFDPIRVGRVREELFKMCERSHINAIYQYFGDFSEQDDPQYAAQLEEFLREASKRKIRVEALTGNPVWALEKNHEACLNWIRGFLDFNSRRPQEARIDGVSLDVEPYLTAEWNSEREKIKEEYLELLAKCRKLIASYNQKFKLGAAIPLLYEIEDGGFERKVIEQLDYIALMDYYDTAKAIIEHGRYHIDLASELGKKVYMGVETQDLVRMNQGKRRNTFIEEGWEFMEQELKSVHEAFKNSPSYAGVAIHSCYAYKLLQRGRNVPTKERPPVDKLYMVHSKESTRPVTIDGDLSDWDLSQHFGVHKKENVVFGAGAWVDPSDLSFAARSQWDKDNLYFSFAMLDNAHVQEKTGSDIWEGDHMELWLDMELEADYNEAINSNDDLQIGLSPGNFAGVKPEVFVWVPELDQTLVLSAEIASRKTEEGYILEARIPAALLYGALEKKAAGFSKGMKLGIMMDASDSDDPRLPQKCMISSSTDRVWGDPTTFGVLSLE